MGDRIMTYDEWKMMTPPTNNNDEVVYLCECCKEEVEEVFTLKIETVNLKPTDSVCGFCLNELHNNLTLNN